MRAFMTRAFRRDATRQGVEARDCIAALDRALRGLVDADLGGMLIKQRIARGSSGAARGSRAIIFYKRGDLAVFLHLFAKSDKANLSQVELREYAKFARYLESLTEDALHSLSVNGKWTELPL
jgi:hypothetical protein